MKKYSLSTFLFFAICAIMLSFYYPFLNQAIGLDVGETGKIVSLGAVFSVLAQPYIGSKFGNAKSKKNFMLKYFALVALIIIAMFIVNKATIVIFAPFYGMLILPMIGSYEMYIENISIEEKFEYSKVRKWGSIGGMFITLISGFTIATFGFKGFDLIGLVLFVVFFLIVFKTFPDVKNSEVSEKVSYKSVLKNKNMVLILIMTFLGVGSYTGIEFAFSSYLVNITNDVAMANNLFSLSLGVRSFIEFISFTLIGLYLKNANLKKCFLSVFILTATRLLLISSGNLPLILIGDQLHSILFPMFLIFVFKYLRAVESDKQLVSSSYALVAVLMFGFPNFIFPTVFGMIQERLGFGAMYIACATLSILTLAIGLIKLPNVKNEEKYIMKLKKTIIPIES